MSTLISIFGPVIIIKEQSIDKLWNNLQLRNAFQFYVSLINLKELYRLLFFSFLRIVVLHFRQHTHECSANQILPSDILVLWHL